METVTEEDFSSSHERLLLVRKFDAPHASSRGLKIKLKVAFHPNPIDPVVYNGRIFPKGKGFYIKLHKSYKMDREIIAYPDGNTEAFQDLWSRMHATRTWKLDE